MKLTAFVASTFVVAVHAFRGDGRQLHKDHRHDDKLGAMVLLAPTESPAASPAPLLTPGKGKGGKELSNRKGKKEEKEGKGSENFTPTVTPAFLNETEAPVVVIVESKKKGKKTGKKGDKTRKLMGMMSARDSLPTATLGETSAPVLAPLGLNETVAPVVPLPKEPSLENKIKNKGKGKGSKAVMKGTSKGKGSKTMDSPVSNSTAAPVTAPIVSDTEASFSPLSKKKKKKKAMMDKQSRLYKQERNENTPALAPTDIGLTKTTAPVLPEPDESEGNFEHNRRKKDKASKGKVHKGVGKGSGPDSPINTNVTAAASVAPVYLKLNETLAPVHPDTPKPKKVGKKAPKKGKSGTKTNKGKEHRSLSMGGKGGKRTKEKGKGKGREDPSSILTNETMAPVIRGVTQAPILPNATNAPVAAPTCGKGKRGGKGKSTGKRTLHETGKGTKAGKGEKKPGKCDSDDEEGEEEVTVYNGKNSTDPTVDGPISGTISASFKTNNEKSSLESQAAKSTASSSGFKMFQSGPIIIITTAAAAIVCNI